MITRGFIEKIRCFFDELGIEATNGISYEEFENKAITTLNRSKELEDAKLVIKFYNYCAKKWKKIEKIFSKYISKWQELNFEESSSIETVDDESSEGVYCITNALIKSKEIFLTSKSFDDEIYSFKFKNGRFMIEDDSDYYLKYSKMNPGTMKLFNKNNNLICNIVLSDTLDIFLEKNLTKYELIIQNEDEEDSFIGIFEKSYINSLKDTDFIDFKNMIAAIEWDLLDSKRDVGVARVNLYQNIDDISLILYFASSTFLLYKSFNDALKSQNFARLVGINRIITRNLRKKTF